MSDEPVSTPEVPEETEGGEDHEGWEPEEAS